MKSEPEIPPSKKHSRKTTPVQNSKFVACCSMVLFLSLVGLLSSGCTLFKVVTIPIKATTTVIGGTADIID